MAEFDYSVVDLVQACYNAGFRPGKGLYFAAAISMAENPMRDLTLVNTEGNTPPSRDRGPFQINDHWHEEVSDECAFNLNCSAVQAFRISNQGEDFGPWVVFRTGAFRRYVDYAKAAHALIQARDVIKQFEAKINANRDSASEAIQLLLMMEEKLEAIRD